jgi:hypothetical protein
LEQTLGILKETYCAVTVVTEQTPHLTCDMVVVETEGSMIMTSVLPGLHRKAGFTANRAFPFLLL